MLQNNLKMKIIIYLIGKDLALKFVTFKISIRMKRLQTDYFQYNLNMNLKKVFKKYIFLIIYRIHIQCLMNIFQNKKLKDTSYAIV